MNKIIQGDCLVELKTLEENSVDSIVTDPPYELGFMGKSWDNSGIANNPDMWREVLRVLKPGGHLLSFGGTRTYHRMSCAIEDAGFEVRDMIEWVYGSGFPKSLNICKAINKTDGVEFESKPALGVGFMNNEIEDGYNPTINQLVQKGESSERAKQWSGWGTALKPAHEPICLARKPLSEKTVAQNVLKWGTGGINIDKSRVSFDAENENFGKEVRDYGDKSGGQWQKGKQERSVPPTTGRFPANLIHDGSEEVRECFPESKSVASKRGGNVSSGEGRYEWNNGDKEDFNKENAYECGFNDSGNASRFFKSIIYKSKASKSERNKGCEGLEEKPKVFNGQSDKPSEDMKDVEKRFTTLPKANNHPTVKPIALMEYLIKMVTPKGGIVLDPFAGSGSTLVAAKQNGYKYIGIEMTPEYIPIIEARLSNIEQTLL